MLCCPLQRLLSARLESDLQRVAVERIRPQQNQPRKHFNQVTLNELAESIKNQGIIQPIVVRREGENFEIVAGERRWRAAQLAGLHEVPVIIKDIAPSAAFELALVENLQRSDLDPIETAEAYQRLIEEHNYTQHALAERLGKSRVAVTNTMRLLQLPPEVRQLIVSGKLSEGHGRALLGASNEDEMFFHAQEAVKHHWSVRTTEENIRFLKLPAEVRELHSTGQIASDHANELLNVADHGRAIRLAREVVRAKWSSQELKEAIIRGDDPKPFVQPQGQIQPSAQGQSSAQPQAQPQISAHGPIQSVPVAHIAQSNGSSGEFVETDEPTNVKSDGENTESSAPPPPPLPSSVVSAKSGTHKNPNVRDIEKKLSSALGMSVVIRDETSVTGVVEIAYDNLDQFDHFCSKIFGN